MDAEGAVMFLHIAVVIVTFMMAAVLHAALVQMLRAERSSELRVWAPLIRRLEPLMPVGALLILGTGWWLLELSDGEFSWSQGWVLASGIALVVVEAVAGVFLPRRTRSLIAAISDAGDGPVPAAVQQRILDPILWYVSHFATVVFFGVVFLMAAKPAGVWTPIAVLIASAIIGLLTAVPFVRFGRHRITRSRPGGSLQEQPTGARVG